MRILHLGWGFKPFRGGGLIEYAENLMEIQVQKGYDVFYFCTGRADLFTKKSYLKKWKSRYGYPIFEIINPPIISGLDAGIREPLFDIYEPLTEQFFWQVFDEIKPEVVHFQEFLGVPTTLIKGLKKRGIKTVYTIADYFPLCPTVKLLQPGRVFCTLKDESLGVQCVKCCAGAPKNNLTYRLVRSTESFIDWGRIMKFRNTIKNRKPAQSSLTTNHDLERPELSTEFSNPRVAEYNFRRKANLENLHELDLIISISDRVTEIFNFYSSFKNLISVQVTLKNIGRIQPRKIKLDENQKINFAVINAMSTALKGSDLLLELFKQIQGSDLKDRVCFVILGFVPFENQQLLKEFSFVNNVGKYDSTKLDQMLDDLKIHVGMVPSTWEEAYGFVGVEFLAKGIPVIGNKKGGIPSYTKENESGWLNSSVTADELYQIIKTITQNPQKIEFLNANLLANRDIFVKDLPKHFKEMDNLYKCLLERDAQAV